MCKAQQPVLQFDSMLTSDGGRVAPHQLGQQADEGGCHLLLQYKVGTSPCIQLPMHRGN